MITPQMIARAMKRILDQPLFVRLYVEPMPLEEELITEVQGGGYDSVRYTLADWLMTPGALATAEGRVVEFRFDGSKRIKVGGHYVTQADGGILWILPFRDGPIDVGRRGDVIPVRPIAKLGMLLVE